MRAVATLFRQSFTGTRLSTSLTIAGLALLAAGCTMQLIVPSWTLGTGMNRTLSLAMQSLVEATPWLAVLALFVATSAQPRVVRGLVFGHAAATLPHVRRSALLGVIAVALAVSLAAATPAALFFVGYPIEVDLAAIFGRSFAVAFVNFGLLYVAFLALAYLRGIWFFVGPALIFVAISVPVNLLNDPGEAFGWRLLAGTAGWLAYAALILAGDRIVRLASRWRAALGRWHVRSGAAAPEPKSAVALLFGADRPWIAAVSQCLPVALALWFAPDREYLLFALVLFALVLFSALGGARSVLAAPRGRSLWLKTDANLDQLFRHAEQAFWGQSAISLAVAMLLLAGVGAAIGYPVSLIAIGLALLVLATAAGLYLGLAMTRGLPLADALLAAVTMGLVVAATVVAIRSQRPTETLLVLGAALLAVTIWLRFLARARWLVLDWMRCRPTESN